MPKAVRAAKKLCPPLVAKRGLGQTVYPHSRGQWRAFFTEHVAHSDIKEIFLVMPSVQSSLPKISYDDAVEEALCFGWIDSTVYPVSTNLRCQRYTPRRPKSPYSQLNIERIRWLLQQPTSVAGDSTLQIPDSKLRESLEELCKTNLTEFRIDKDILTALRAVPKAWKFWNSCSPAYRRVRAAYVSLRDLTDAERGKRIQNLVKNCQQEKLFGTKLDRYGE